MAVATDLAPHNMVDLPSFFLKHVRSDRLSPLDFNIVGLASTFSQESPSGVSKRRLFEAITA